MTLADPGIDLALLAEARNDGASQAERSAAFGKLYERHQGALYRFSFLRSGSADAAADIVQEVFMGLITAKLNFDPTRGALQGFLFGVARHLVLKRESGFQRFVALDTNDDDDDIVLVDPVCQPIEKLLSDGRAEQVRQALAKVPPHYRDVLILYEMHDFSYVEVAQICGIDIGTVRSRLSRARARMLALLANSCGEQVSKVQVAKIN